MGLDSVEIVMEVEDRFGITIRDSEAQNIRTVGDLLALIKLRMVSPATVCPSLTGFLQIRGVVRAFLSRSNLRLRPATQIASVVPIGRRREFWCKLTEIYGSAPPALRRPLPLRLFLLGVSCVLIAVGVGPAYIDPAILPLGVMSAIGCIIALYLITLPLCVEPPAKFATFGEVSQRLVGLTRATRPITASDEIMVGVRKIVVSILGVDEDEVVPEARFVEDLNMT